MGLLIVGSTSPGSKCLQDGALGDNIKVVLVLFVSMKGAILPITFYIRFF